MNELSREEIDAIMKKQGLVYGWWKDNMKGVNKIKCLENAAHIDEYINSIMAKCTEQTEVLILCEMAKGYLKEQRPHGEWIPCSERLPERDEIVLVSFKTGRVHPCKYLDDGSENPWWSYLDDCCAWNNTVVAWMPLPEPYKKEGE